MAVFDTIKNGALLRWKLYYPPLRHPIVNDRWSGMYFWLLTRTFLYTIFFLLLVQKRLGLLAFLLMVGWGYFSKHFLDRDFPFWWGFGIFFGIMIFGGIIYGI